MDIRIEEASFDLNAEHAALARRAGDIGAIVSFTGYVRADGDVEAIVLEHYPAMTEKELRRIAVIALNRFNLADLTIIHRVGRLVVGEPIVLVLTASPHRASAFEGAQFLMDYLKTNAPLWKAEIRAGTAHWVAMKDSDAARAARWQVIDSGAARG